MKILVPAIGSRGDVQPYIALCQGLQEAGHQVTLATNPTLYDLVTSYNVPCAKVGKPVDMGLEGARIWAKAGRNWWLGFIRIMQFGNALMQDAFNDILELCQGVDLVVTTDITAGSVEADKLGIPWVSVTLQPGRIPTPALKPSWPMGVILSGIESLVTAPVNRFRKKVGAPPVKGGITGVLSPRLILLPVSPHVSPPDLRWPGHVSMTGYWFARSPQKWTPPKELQAFLETGEPVVAVSLGALGLVGKGTLESAEITIQALQELGLRAVVQGWHEALSNKKLPPTIYHAGSLPHGWLFRRVQAVIHHGGFGTTASALYAGVPAVVVPHIIDQFYWGQKVVELGTGPEYIPRHELTTAKLAERLQQAMRDADMRKKAAALGESIRGEPDGVQAAARILEKFGKGQ